MAKRGELLRDMETPMVFGIELDRETLTPKRMVIDVTKPGDYGCDPMGDGTFRMVPSGEIVSREEMSRRLS